MFICMKDRKIQSVLQNRACFFIISDRKKRVSTYEKSGKSNMNKKKQGEEIWGMRQQELKWQRLNFGVE